MVNSVQGGYIGNAGAPDTTVAGTWTRDPFPQGQQPGVNQLWRRGMDNTPTGQRIKNLRDVMESNPGAVLGPQAMGQPAMNIGNVASMSTAFNPFAGPGEPFTRYTQGIENMQDKDKVDNVSQQPTEMEEPLISGTGNPFGRYIQAITNMQQTKQAGFNRKTVS
jgi:hypothetical protein